MTAQPRPEIVEPTDEEIVSLTATPLQQKYLEAVLRDDLMFLGVGGGVAGSKTFCVLIALVVLCRLYPGSRWAIVRKDLPTLRNTTLQSFAEIRYRCHWLNGVNQSTWTSTCPNGSQLIFFPEQAERDKERNRWRGLAVNGFALEEANELEEASFDKAKERAGRWIIPATPERPNPVQPVPKILCTFNPCDNWPREHFYEPFMDGTIEAPWYYLPATQVDNPYITDVQRAIWEEMPEAQYNRFIKGDWSVTDEPDQLISGAWLHAAAKVPFVDGPDREGVDVARYGDDSTVFCRMRGNALLGLHDYHGLSIDRTVDIIAQRITGQWLDPDDEERRTRYPPVPADRLWLDSVAIGAGVFDFLTRRGIHVREFIAGGKPIIRRVAVDLPPSLGRPPQSVLKFKNLRSQAWYELAEKLRQGKIHIPPGMLHPDLRRDLLGIRYSVGSDKLFEIELKDDFKKRVGASPDFGDAFMQANFDPPAGPRRFTSEDFASLQR